MEQKFKYDHMIVVYHGNNKYTLTAAKGYVLQSGNRQEQQVETRDYTKWQAIEAPAQAPKPSKAKKAKSKPLTA